MADEDEPDAQFSVAVEDFGGAWAHVAQARHARAAPEPDAAALCAPSVHRCHAHGRALAAQALAERLPLKNITLPNKFGNPVPLDSLHIRCAARAAMHSAPRLHAACGARTHAAEHLLIRTGINAQQFSSTWARA